MYDLARVKRVFDKYQVKRILWYVDYPEKPHWKQPFGQRDLEDGLLELHRQPAALLYVHMPYCHTQCYFCNCKTIISRDYKNVVDYMEYLYKEIRLHREFCDRHGVTPAFTEIHLGGGSPTYLSEDDFKRLKEHLGLLVDFDKVSEFSIEIDPRRLNPDRMLFYHQMGINRISFGVQDIEPDVQKAINRNQPDFLIRRLIVPEIRSLFPNGVNFDVMGGLPNQTPDSFRRTIEKVIEMSPDRVSLLQMSIVPDHSPHQLLMPLDKVPSNYEMKLLLIDALEMLTSNGYRRTAYDHFAKPSDSVVEAKDGHKMTWGYYGPTAGRYEDVLGLGISSYSRLGDHFYSQNVYELDNWKQAVSDGTFALYRGHRLSDDDVLRRKVIQGIRNYFGVDYGAYDVEFPAYFSREMDVMAEFAEDGLVELHPDHMELTEFGSLFADFIAGTFDAYRPADVHATA